MKKKNNIFYTGVGLVLAIVVLGLIFGLYKEIDKAEAQGTTNPFAGYILSGYAWSENIGWISFNCKNNNSCGKVDYKVKVNENKTLSGYAWSENIGWISFNASDLNGCPSAPCEARISDDNTKITGWARAIRPKIPEGQTLGGWEGWIKLSGSGYGLGITEITPSPNSSVKKYQISGFVWGGGGNSRDSAVIGWTKFKGDTYGVVIEPEPTGEPEPTETTDGGCNRNQPSIEVSPSSLEWNDNDLTYTLTITNNDSNCGASSFDIKLEEQKEQENKKCLIYPKNNFTTEAISSGRSVRIDITVNASNCDEGTYTTKVKATNISSDMSSEALFNTIVPPSPNPPPENLNVDFKCSRSQTDSTEDYVDCDKIGRLGKDGTLYLEDITSTINEGLILSESSDLVSRKWTLFDGEEKEVASCEIGRDSPKYCIISSSDYKRAKVKVLLGRFKVKLEDTYESNNITYTGSNEHWFTGYIGIGGSWNEDSEF